MNPIDRLFGHHGAREEESRLREDLLASLLTMAWMVEARDPYTGGHLWRVSRFSLRLAEAAGLPRKAAALAEIGGFLHDLGKVGVPDAILSKPDRLSADEFAVIRTHPAVGARLLAAHPLAGLALAAVAGHHERPDGGGYPRGDPAEAIPQVARIVGIADAFDAMTSNRPYRRGMGIDAALGVIEGGLGTQFDPALGRHFVALGRTGELAHIVGHSEPGIPVFPCPGCGSAMVVRRGQRPGDHTYCRGCGAEARIRREEGRIALEPTGQRGDPGVLAPDADLELIGELIAEAAPHVL